jgi:hypothetical protein
MRSRRVVGIIAVDEDMARDLEKEREYIEGKVKEKLTPLQK